MFVAHASRTMANARPKFREPQPEIRRNVCRQNVVVQLTVPKPDPEAERIKAEKAKWRRLMAAVDELQAEERSETYVPPTRKPMLEIVRAVERATGVSLDEMRGPSRFKNISAARFDAIAAVRRERPDLSLPVIGRFFNRDHSSIHHALQRRGMITASEDWRPVQAA